MSPLTPMPKSSRTPDTPEPVLPPELAERLALIERQGREGDMDAFSWFWLIALGVVLPVLLLIAGWQL